MRTVSQITSAVGQPRALRIIGSDAQSVAAIARWSHEGADIDLRGSDTYQVVFNLSGGQFIEFAAGDAEVVRREVRAGSVALNVPGQHTRINVSGHADTLHIMMTPRWIDAVSGGDAARGGAQLACREAELRAAAAQALVALEQPGKRNERELERIVRAIAQGFAAPAAFVKKRATGGLSPGARRRVWALVEARIGDSSRPSPKLRELASAAGLSLHHFAKAFRLTEGQTPHARLLGVRLEYALELLLRSNARVDAASHEAGFSSPAHFVSVFRRQLGVTPGALRDAVWQ